MTRLNRRTEAAASIGLLRAKQVFAFNSTYLRAEIIKRMERVTVMLDTKGMTRKNNVNDLGEGKISVVAGRFIIAVLRSTR